MSDYPQTRQEQIAYLQMCAKKRFPPVLSKITYSDLLTEADKLHKALEIIVRVVEKLDYQNENHRS